MGAKKFRFFAKNYSKKQIVLDPENFDLFISYATEKMSLKEISKLPLAQTLGGDLIRIPFSAPSSLQIGKSISSKMKNRY